MEVKKITFEESKEILKKTIDNSDTINQVIENFIQSIYAKGYDDALNNMLAPIERSAPVNGKEEKND